MSGKQLVIFGVSNILSELFDCALANGLTIAKIVLHHPEQVGERDVSLADRLASLSRFCTPPQVLQWDEFVPQADEVYMLGPTTPSRAAIAQELQQRHSLRFHTLVHPRAYVSPLASLGEGVFVGVNSSIAADAQLAPHVFINRGVSVGHDTKIGEFSRLQPGCNVGGLTRIGQGVTIGIGATVLERLVIGDGALVAAGAVVLSDVAPHVLVAGVPAKVKKSLI
jgi:sugar O-acyltransferase (sialic acid O-acetyltransferase NeuD family)